MTNFNTLSTLTNSYECSTLSNNLFEAAVKSLAVSAKKEGANTTFFFADGATLDCDSLNPFELHYATYVSADLSLVKEIRKTA